jgi:hypothetical protein
LLGSDYDGSPYTQSGNLVAELAVRGIRLVIEEFRADVTKTLKDGSRGKLRIDYGDPKEPEKAIAWLWKFIDGAKTAGELYGRALVVIAAEQHACRLVVPSSQQFGAKRWPSHRDHAAKALQKLTGPHLPSTLKQLEKAIAKAGAELHEAQAEAHARKASSVEEDVGAGEETGDPAKASDELDEVGDAFIDEQFEDDDPVNVVGALEPAAHAYSDADPGL